MHPPLSLPDGYTSCLCSATVHGQSRIRLYNLQVRNMRTDPKNMTSSNTMIRVTQSNDTVDEAGTHETLPNDGITYPDCILNEIFQKIFAFFKSTKRLVSPWQGWLSGLGFIPHRERSRVLSLVRAHAWVVGSAPGWGVYERQLIDVALPLFLPPFPSL